MQKIICLSFFLLMSLSHIFSQQSYIQIVSEPGISIFLNGQIVGITNVELSGLYIENLNAGEYTLKFIKEGFTPQEDKITLKAGEVREYKVKPFVPGITIEQSGNESEQSIIQKSGNLKIQSLPISIKIQISSIGINSSKNSDEWQANNIPEGSYKATFSGSNRTLEHNITITDGYLVHLMVNLFKGEVTVIDKKKIADQGLSAYESNDILFVQANSEKTNDSNVDQVFMVVESMPYFPDGDSALLQYIASNINYPELARNKGIQGRVFVTFIIEIDGSISNVKVMRGIGGWCDEEAFRIVKNMPKWNPGKQCGKPVRVQFNLPIKFVLP